jgi:hypothetical protein
MRKFERGIRQRAGCQPYEAPFGKDWTQADRIKDTKPYVKFKKIQSNRKPRRNSRQLLF